MPSCKVFAQITYRSVKLQQHDTT